MIRRLPIRFGAGPLAAASLALAALLAGCAPLIVGGAVVGGAMVATDRRTSGSQVDDEVIELKAKGRMGEAFPDDRVRINTTSYNRMVLLTGEVPSEADILAAPHGDISVMQAWLPWIILCVTVFVWGTDTFKKAADALWLPKYVVPGLDKLIQKMPPAERCSASTSTPVEFALP